MDFSYFSVTKVTKVTKKDPKKGPNDHRVPNFLPDYLSPTFWVTFQGCHFFVQIDQNCKAIVHEIGQKMATLR